VQLVQLYQQLCAQKIYLTDVKTENMMVLPDPNGRIGIVLVDFEGAFFPGDDRKRKCSLTHAYIPDYLVEHGHFYSTDELKAIMAFGFASAIFVVSFRAFPKDTQAMNVARRSIDSLNENARMMWENLLLALDQQSGAQCDAALRAFHIWLVQVTPPEF